MRSFQSYLSPIQTKAPRSKKLISSRFQSYLSPIQTFQRGKQGFRINPEISILSQSNSNNGAPCPAYRQYIISILSQSNSNARASRTSSRFSIISILSQSNSNARATFPKAYAFIIISILSQSNSNVFQTQYFDDVWSISILSQSNSNPWIWGAGLWRPNSFQSYLSPIQTDILPHKLFL